MVKCPVTTVIHIPMTSLTLGVHALDGYSNCLVCLSHLTSGVSVHPENAVTYSASSRGPKNCGVFSETSPLQRSSTPSFEDHTYEL